MVSREEGAKSRGALYRYRHSTLPSSTPPHSRDHHSLLPIGSWRALAVIRNAYSPIADICTTNHGLRASRARRSTFTQAQDHQLCRDRRRYAIRVSFAPEKEKEEVHQDHRSRRSDRRFTQASAPEEGGQAPPKKEGKRASDAPAEEKRRKTYRSEAPQSYLTVKDRTMTQRLTVLSRERCGTDTVPEEKVLIAGSTGNVYTQRIKLVLSCNCLYARFRN